MVEVTPEAAASDGMSWQEAATAAELRLAQREQEMRELTRTGLEAVAISRAATSNFNRLAAWHQHWKTRATQYQGALAKVRRYAEQHGDTELLAILGDANLAANQPCNCGPACPVDAVQPHTTMEAYKVERAAEAGG